MSNPPQNIYFDETGFTGNNLLDPQQTLFVYAGIAMDEDFAFQICSEAISRFRLNGQELKGSNLTKHSRGREAVTWILGKVSPYSHVMIANKRYALAGRFFEYIFEPALAKHSSLFYAIDFHRFIATLLYIFSRENDLHGNNILKGFVDMMSNTDPGQLEKLLMPVDELEQSNPLGMILAFASCHRKTIANEVERLGSADDVVGIWPLELSMTALHWLLATWGEEYETLQVYCDNSKPIQTALPMFDEFIGRKDKSYIRFGNKVSPSIVYNLAGPIQMVDSKSYPGVQVADVVARSVADAFMNPEDVLSQEWICLTEGAITNPMVPEPSLIDLTQEECFVNTTVLRELVDRSIRGQDLFEDMASIVLGAKAVYPQYAREIASIPP